MKKIYKTVKKTSPTDKKTYENDLEGNPGFKKNNKHYRN